MAINDYDILPFAGPVFSPVPAEQVRGNDETLRAKFVAHQADAVAHVTSGTAAARPVSGTTGQVYVATDTGVISYWDGAAWQTIGSTSMVSGPASSTDNAIARFDGTTGKLIQNSLVTVSDTGQMAIDAGSVDDAFIVTSTFNGYQAKVRYDATHYLGIGVTSTGNTTIRVFGDAAASPLGFFGGTGSAINFTSAAINFFGLTGKISFETTNATTAEFRYDSSNYVALSVSAAGLATFNAVGASAGFVFSDAMTVSTGGITVTGASTITGTLGGITTLTAAAANVNGQTVVTTTGSNGLLLRYDATAGSNAGFTISNVGDMSIGPVGSFFDRNLSFRYRVTIADESGSTSTTDSTALGLPAGSTTMSPLRIAHGVAPTAPVNGDVWTTTAGVYARINGATVGPFSAGGGTGDVVGPASATDSALAVFDTATGKLLKNSTLIYSGGFLGFGTTPSYAIHIREDADNEIRIGTSSNTTAYLTLKYEDVTGDAIIDAVTPGAGLSVRTNGSVRMVFSSSSAQAYVPLVAPAATTSITSFRAPHGTAPSAPTNGDIWTTTAGLYAQINGSTVGPMGAGGGSGLTQPQVMARTLGC